MNAGVVALFASGDELWISDGTSEGTVTLASVAPQVSGLYNRGIGQFDDGHYLFLSKTYLSENDAHEFGNDFQDIWITDGTAAGTRVLASIPAEVEGFGPGFGLNYLGSGISSLYVSYEDWGSDDPVLPVHSLSFRTDGTPAGTVLSPTTPLSLPPGDPVALGNGKSVYVSSDAEHGRELWVTDGTPAGTTLLKDFNPGSGSSSYQEIFSTGNGQALLSANGALWVTDGTPVGTTLLAADSVGNPGSLSPSAFLELPDGQVLFMGMRWEYSGSSGWGYSSHIWVTDHTAAGTRFISDSSIDATTRPPAVLPDGQILFIKSGDLWISDCTTEGTRKLVDIYAGNLAGIPEVSGSLVPLPDGRVLFQGNDGVHGKELWVTDGTAAGTHLLKDIFEGAWGSAPDDWEALPDGTVMFRAYEPTTGGELWITDGTAEGTRVVRDTQPPPGTSGGASGVVTLPPIALGDGRFVFTATDGAHGNEVWITDGSADGTQLLKDVAPGLGSAGGGALMAIGNGRALFTPVTAEHGRELWVTDGSSSGTRMLADITPGAAPTYFTNFTTLADGKALFIANSGGSANTWITDGTTVGTFLLSSVSVTSDFTDLGNGRALFSGYEASGTRQLWSTDGTTAGTTTIQAGLAEGVTAAGERIVNTQRDADQNPTAAATLANGSQIVVWTSSGQDGSGDGVYAQRFAADGSPTGAEFRVNSTTASHQSEGAVSALSGGGFVVVWNSSGQDGNLSGIVGRLFDSNGTAVGNEFIVNNHRTNEQYTPEVQGLATGGFVVSWSSLLQDGSHLGVFARRFDASGNALDTADIQVNGTTASEQHGSDIAAWSDGSFIITWRSSGASGYDVFAQLFTAAGSKIGGEFRVNQTAAGNQFDGQVAVLADGDFVVTWRSQGQDGNGDEVYARQFTRDGQAAGNEFRVNTTLVDNQAAPAIVALSDGDYAIAWRSTGQDGDGFGVFARRYDADGIPQGSEFAVNAEATGNQGDYLNLAPGTSGGFTAYWSSDGGQDGSGSGVIARSFDADGNAVIALSPVTSPGAFFALQDGRALFAAHDAQGDVELWVSDGTATGTRVVMDIHPTASSAPVAVALLEAGRALVIATDATHGRELWVTDGSQGGTRLVADINPGTGSSNASGFVSLGDGRVLFSATDGTSGAEPWITDGTAAGTFRLGDLYAGISGSMQYTAGSYCALGNGKVIFAADTYANGRELWVTNGTAAGTSMLADIHPVVDKYGRGLSSGVDNFTALGDGRAVFSASNGNVNGLELWITDGTASGTMLLKDINPAVIAGTTPLAQSSMPEDFVATGDGRVLFFANDGVHGQELWITDGTSAGTTLVRDINTLPLQLYNVDLLGTLDRNVAPQHTGTPVVLAGATEDVAYTFARNSLLSGYTDADGDPLSIGTITASAGTLTDNGNGTLTLTAPANFAGTVTLHFTVIDGVGGSTPASTTLIVSNVNETGTAGNDTLVASPGGDNLIGLAGDDSLTGSAGDDTLNGGPGNDTMAGGAGNDVYVVDSASDILTESTLAADIDTVRSSVNWTLPFLFENLVLTGDAPVTGTGNALDNAITGNASANLLEGRSGNDMLSGYGGDDTLDGGTGDDSLAGGTGNDTYIVNSTGDIVVETTSATDIDTVQSSIDWMLGNQLENLTLTGSTAVTGMGNALANRITGNNLGNTLIGEGGNDTLDGGAGSDTLDGGSGDDTYVVNATGDTIVESSLPGAGEDTVQSTVGWTLGDNLENLVLQGTLSLAGIGNELANRLTGNGAANMLDGRGGQDTLAGGDGDDTYLVDTAFDVVKEVSSSGGSDTVKSTVSWTLGAFVENLVLTSALPANGSGNGLDNSITGNAQENSLVGGAGNDMIIGQGGADTLTGGTGNDTLIGGNGGDTYYVDSALDVVDEYGSNDSIDYVFSTVDWTLGESIEILQLLGSSAIKATGNALDNTLDGNSIGNILQGGAGNDTLRGNDGRDTLVGGAGSDYYVVESLHDVISESGPTTETDNVVSFVNWALGANLEHLELLGTALKATGNTLDNRITGNALANTLNGWTGKDTLVGGAGNDTYVVDNLLDEIVETGIADIDTVLSSVEWRLAAPLENVTLKGSASVGARGNESDNVIVGNIGDNLLDGLGGNDTLRGNAGNDTLQGGSGNDSMLGGTGNDTYIVDSTADRVTETSASVSEIDVVQSSVDWTLGGNVENLVLTGTDTIYGTGNALSNTLTGNGGANQLAGVDGADLLTGFGGNDTLLGGNGNDTLSGGAGTDVLDGGDGMDTFLFDDTPRLATLDSLTSYESGIDRIVLDDAVFTTLTAGTLAADAFRLDTTARDADDRIIYDQVTGALYYDADGSLSGSMKIKFAIIESLQPLAATDIQIA